MPDLTVACVKWGTLYSADYVRILADSVSRHLSLPHRFVCFTDDAGGLEGIETHPLPPELEGWWGKLWLFSRDAGLSGRVLYLDLDTLVVRSLDQIAAYDGPFAILRDFYRPDGYGSAVMAWDADHWRNVWSSWCEAGRPQLEGGDQAWIERCISTADRWQDLHPGAFVSFKEDCTNGPPRDARVICFHGTPRPHECGDWVPAVWRVGGLNPVEYEAVSNYPLEDKLRQVEENIRRPISWLLPERPHGDTAVLVGGGPSLEDNLMHVRRRRNSGQDVFALNGAHDYLISKRIVPHFMVMMDARPENARFVQKPSGNVRYLMASMVHPSVLDALEGQDVVFWHAAEDGLWERVLSRYKEHPVAAIGGGGTVGLRALSLLYQLGYRKFHLYGYDSSFRLGKDHAYEQDLNAGQEVQRVTVGDQEFLATWWMIRQADLFQAQAAGLARLGCQVVVHGGGLIPALARQMNAQGERSAYEHHPRADGPRVGAAP